MSQTTCRYCYGECTDAERVLHRDGDAFHHRCHLMTRGEVRNDVDAVRAAIENVMNDHYANYGMRVFNLDRGETYLSAA